MRTYDQYCGIAKAMDILGQRWTALVLRELLLGPRRYSELQRGLPGIPTNLLASRLKELQRLGLLEQVHRNSDGRRVWSLTELGESARPALLALGAFGSYWMGDPGEHHLSGRWFVVSLQRRFRGSPDAADIGLEIDGEPYSVSIGHQGLVSSDGWPGDPSLSIRGPLSGVVAALLGEGPVPADVAVEGPAGVLASLRTGLSTRSQGPTGAT